MYKLPIFTAQYSMLMTNQLYLSMWWPITMLHTLDTWQCALLSTGKNQSAIWQSINQSEISIWFIYVGLWILEWSWLILNILSTLIKKFLVNYWKVMMMFLFHCCNKDSSVYMKLVRISANQSSVNQSNISNSRQGSDRKVWRNFQQCSEPMW